MSLPNGSIANLLVTRKSHLRRNLRCPFPVPSFEADEGMSGGQRKNKKPALGKAPASDKEYSSRPTICGPSASL
jgi:hypothetical protein